jgi:hypothetical protein
MKVKNTGFLLDRLGEDCHPLQYLRELTTNAIEAILRTPKQTGEVVWDVDWITHDLEGEYKLCITDSGDGMTGPQMVEYINQLSSSGAEQSMSGNYGIGAKIATATRNHHGVMYVSWRGGQGALIHLWKDTVTGAYGLKQFRTNSGEYQHFMCVEDEVKPSIIADHGTKVVLLGNSESQDTMQAPLNVASPSRWISKYLNTRYYRFPKGISVKAREGWQNPRADKDRNVTRTITGQEPYLKDHAVSSGRVKLTNATANWWILKDEPALGNNSGFVESAGHMAALYQDELYELVTGRSGTARLQNFGVIFGYRQVVIYVESASTPERKLTTNTARTMLLVNNELLPWADWAIEFRDNMPKEISALIAEKAAAASVADHSKSIRERLKQVLDLFKVSRYRPSPDGPFLIDDQTLARGGQPKRENLTAQSGSGGHGTGEGGTAGGVYAIFEKENGKSGDRVQPDLFPSVNWISTKDGTRTPGDLEDRAARFLIEQNRLLINADFRVFTDMISKFTKDLGGNPALYEVVEDAVHGWFEQALIETVIGIQALRNSKEWSVAALEAALSDEALTTAVMPRYHVHNSVKRELGSKLGKLEVTAPA